eukprot:10550400-Ditylum_brightwellii.AAC.1
MKEGTGRISTNICHKDNCSGRYKCHQTFLQIGQSYYRRKTTFIHKFAQKYGFKGSWDATGKLVKQTIS